MTGNGEKSKLTAGDKCAFANMIFAKTEEGWTPATKMLAITYIDLSEKYGYAFAGQWYFEFRTGLSKRTMSRSNKTIQNSGLFDLRYLSDDRLEVVPNLERIRAEYEKYQLADIRVRQERQDKMSAGSRRNVAGSPDKMSVVPRRNGAHNLSKESLDTNPSIKLIPGLRSETGMRASCEDHSASGADRSHYRQTADEAKQIWEEIKSEWPGPSEDAEHQPQHDSEKGALIHYYRLLKSGVSARRIRHAVLRFLEDRERDQQWCCSFVVFLSRYLPDYLDPDQPELFIPDDDGGQPSKTQSQDDAVTAKQVMPPAASNDNGTHDGPFGAVVGQQWEYWSETCGEDAPF